MRLPADIYARGKANFAARKTGTQFLDAKMEKVSGPLSKVYQKK